MQTHGSRRDRESKPDSPARRIADFVHSEKRLCQPREIGFRHAWTSVANSDRDSGWCVRDLDADIGTRRRIANRVTKDVLHRAA